MAASLAGLVVISLFIIVLPILCAVAFSTWNAERQLAESRDLVARAVALTALGESVDDQVGLMQRSARRYQRNGAATEEQKLHKRQDQLLEVLDDMAEQQEDAGPREIVRELQDLVQLPIKEVDKLPVTKAAKRARIETFSEMRELSDDMQQANRRALADRLSALAERNAASRTGLLMGSGVMALLAVILVVLLGRLISYPLGQILDGIRRLGRSELEESIAVRGTAELRQVGRELEWLRNRLRNIDEERNAFLRQVSHDLKTPLTNIKEGGGLLLEGIVTPARSEQILRIIYRNALRLETLIAQLFDFTAAVHQPSNVPPRCCALDAIVARQVSEYELQIASRKLSVDFRHSGPVLLVGDPERLSRLVDNLLSNAIKFSPAGATITIDAWSSRSQVCLEIRDQGPGFSSEDRIRAFDPFFRGTPAVASDVPGTGIGLSVAQACAQAHGGIIEILTPMQPGARLLVRLPQTTGPPMQHV
ncbi:MAG: ATP-binding protein, partial [Pseudomonadales bacterium]